MTDLIDLTRSVDLYITRGCPTGGFLEAVISNDLKEAMARADEGSRAVLFELVCYLYNECPGGCWGSPERYRDWLSMDSDERLRLVGASKYGLRRGVGSSVRGERQ